MGFLPLSEVLWLHTDCPGMGQTPSLIPADHDLLIHVGGHMRGIEVPKPWLLNSWAGDEPGAGYRAANVA